MAQNSGATVPTGDVSLIAEPTTGPQFGVDFGTLGAPSPAGQVVIATNELPGGTYPVIAHYAGDGTFAPSDSAPFNVTVSKENSTTQTTLLAVDPISGNLSTVTSVPYGSIYLFRTDVIGTQNGDNQICSQAPPPGIPCPTGTITLTDTGGVPIKDFLSTATGGSTNVATLNAIGFQEDRLLRNHRTYRRRAQLHDSVLWRQQLQCKPDKFANHYRGSLHRDRRDSKRESHGNCDRGAICDPYGHSLRVLLQCGGQRQFPKRGRWTNRLRYIFDLRFGSVLHGDSSADGL